VQDYEVSNFGRLKSSKVGKKELKGSIIEGYNRVHLRINETKKIKIQKHRLIMDSWCPINESNAPEGFPEEDWQKLSCDAKTYIGSILLINHKDHNKTNNNITNLERVTPKQNSAKAKNKNRVGPQINPNKIC
jgi:hypothetical protein